MTFYDKLLIMSIMLICIFFIIFPFRTFFVNENTDMKDKLIMIQSDEGIQKIPVAETYRPEPYLLSVEGPMGTTVIEAHNGRVRVKEEPEDDRYRIAEKQGWIDDSTPLSIIINMPNKVVIWFNNQEEEQAIDGISY